MKARIALALALAMLLLVGMLALVSPSQAQTTVLPEPTIEILEESPDSIFVFHVSPTTAELGQSVWLLYAWGYLGDPTQRLTVTTYIPAGIDPGGCPDGCVTVMHLERDPWGGAGISASIPATATVVGEHTMVAYFEDDFGVSQTLSATLTVVQAPPTAVRLNELNASPTAPQTNWTLIAIALLAVACGGFFVRRHVHN